MPIAISASTAAPSAGATKPASAISRRNTTSTKLPIPPSSNGSPNSIRSPASKLFAAFSVKCFSAATTPPSPSKRSPAEKPRAFFSAASCFSSPTCSSSTSLRTTSISNPSTRSTSRSKNTRAPSSSSPTTTTFSTKSPRASGTSITATSTISKVLTPTSSPTKNAKPRKPPAPAVNFSSLSIAVVGAAFRSGPLGCGNRRSLPVHPRQHAPHIRHTFHHARQRRFLMNLILQIHKSRVPNRQQRLENFLHRHLSFANRHLTLFIRKTRQILHVHVEHARPHFANRLHHVHSGSRRVSHVNAASHPRIHPLHRLQHFQRRRPQLIFRPMIVQRKFDVVLLHEFFNSRQRRRRRIARHDHANPRALRILKLRPNVRIFIFIKIDRSRRMQLQSRRYVVSQRLDFRHRFHRQMVLRVLQIQIGHARLLQ